MKKKIIALLLVLAFSLTSCLSLASANGAVALGQPFPDFSVTDSDGISLTVSEALKDHKAVLVNFWATWCGWCVYEFPFLNEVYNEYKDRVAFIALTVGGSDTVKVINDFRKENGISYPMGRDENSELYAAVDAAGLPTTVIIDRFGNLVFNHAGAFKSADEFRRVLDVFVSDNYTESAVLNEIPKEYSTNAFPVSAHRALTVENENAWKIVFKSDNYSDVPCWIVPDKTAKIRLEISASDNPGVLLFNEQNNSFISYLSTLLDRENNVFTYNMSVPSAEDPWHYNYGLLTNPGLENDPDDAEILVIPSEEYIEEIVELLQAIGIENVTWAREDSAPVKSSDKQGAYTLHVIDQEGNPVPEVSVSFCTDQACVPCESDESGVITFTGEPFAYHVQIVDVPEGYSWDESFELTTTPEYGEWLLRIRKD